VALFGGKKMKTLENEILQETLLLSIDFAKVKYITPKT